jgi:hypothetical protein
MQIRWFLTFWLASGLCSMSAMASAAPVRFGSRVAQGVTETNFVRIAAVPERLDSKIVFFTAIIRRYDSSWYLFNSEDDMRMLRLDSAIMCVIEPTQINLPKLAETCDGKLVFLEGVFKARRESESPPTIGMLKVNYVGLN